LTATVVVTDGEQRAALATVRSLGKAGYRVIVCASSRHSISGSSRFAASQTVVADPLRSPEQFFLDVARVADVERAEVLLPVTEAALLAVLPNRDAFRCCVPFASADVFARICDKSDVLKVAALQGIEVPIQRELAGPEDSVALRDWSHFPVVLKPYRSVSTNGNARVRGSVTYAANRDALEAALHAIPRAAYPVLAQERIEGPGFGISLLIWDGVVKAAFAHRRLREKPPSGGVSVLRESIPLDADLLSRSADLLRAFDWQGVAMVEFKLNDKTNAPYLMEVNGRLWGSLQLAIDAGVDFPALLVKLALGENPAPVLSYPAGVRSRWEWGDLDNLLASLFHSDRKLVLSTGNGKRNRLRSMTDFLKDLTAMNEAEIFRRDDPKPFLRESLNWFRSL
jgi:predicted ATP-grasp superfamily ATP-dependent carboligase